MANKPTKRERRETARRARLEAQRRAARRKRMRVIWGSLVGVAAIAGIVVAVVLSNRSSTLARGELDDLAAAAGCETPQSVPEEGRNHTGDINVAVDYQTEPPTSGDHFDQWEDTGIHLTPIPETVQVHNLEHGHVGVQYTDELPDDVITALEEAVRGDNRWAFLAPKPDMDVPLAFNAWTRLSRCETPGDASSVGDYASQFIAQMKQGGPETIAGTPR